MPNFNTRQFYCVKVSVNDEVLHHGVKPMNIWSKNAYRFTYDNDKDDRLPPLNVQVVAQVFNSHEQLSLSEIKRAQKEKEEEQQSFAHAKGGVEKKHAHRETNPVLRMAHHVTNIIGGKKGVDDESNSLKQKK